MAFPYCTATAFHARTPLVCLQANMITTGEPNLFHELRGL